MQELSLIYTRRLISRFISLQGGGGHNLHGSSRIAMQRTSWPVVLGSAAGWSPLSVSPQLHTPFWSRPRLSSIGLDVGPAHVGPSGQWLTWRRVGLHLGFSIPRDCMAGRLSCMACSPYVDNPSCRVVSCPKFHRGFMLLTHANCETTARSHEQVHGTVVLTLNYIAE